MKKNKGFTLVELLVTISLLAILMLIAVPSLMNLINSNKEAQYENYEKTLIEGAKLHVDKLHSLGLSGDGGCMLIPFADLKKGNYVKGFKTDTMDCETDTYVRVERKNGNLVYTPLLKCKEKDKEYKSKDYDTNLIANCLAYDPGEATLFTPDRCFEFDANTGTITNYLCYQGNLYGRPVITEVQIPPKIRNVPVTAIGSGSFEKKALTRVVIPRNVVTIGNGAFQGNYLNYIYLPNTLTTIGASAFRHQNRGITNNSLVIPDSVTTIGPNAFWQSQIVNLKISKNIKVIPEGAFYGNELPSVEIPSGVTTIGKLAFSKNKIVKLSLPQTVIEINREAFNNNKLPDNEAMVYKYNTDGTIDDTFLASYGGERKDDIVIPGNVKIIAEGAFNDCGINSVVIPNSVTEIQSEGFARNNLVTISIPESVDTLDTFAFAWNKLKTVNLPEGLKTIDAWAFGHNQLTNITLPNSLEKIGQAAFNDNLLVDNEAFIYNLINGNIDKTTVISYGGAKKDITVPKEIKLIGPYSFSQSKLTSVTIGPTVREIQTGAFQSNDIASLALSEGLTTIGTYAFQGNQLTSVTIPSTVNNLASTSFDSKVNIIRK